MRRAILFSLILVIPLATSAARQSRDASNGAPATGTSVVSGVVVTDSETPRPVRRATVRLEGDAGTSARLVGTDDGGRFTFDALPAGRFTLSATRPGYVRTFHGSRRPGRGPGVAFDVADGARVDISLRMLPGAAITGTITNSAGQPLPGVGVFGVELRPATAPLALPGRAMTDDRGIYRLYGLAPGDYLVGADPRLGPFVITGDITRTTDAEAQWLQQAGATMAPGRTPPPLPRGTGGVGGYSHVFFPGTSDVAAAARITVVAGEERAGVGFVLRPVSLARISGRLVDAGGQPVIAGALVTIFQRGGNDPLMAQTIVASNALMMPRATMSPQGFRISGVPPGEYTVVARTGSGRGTMAAAPSTWSISELVVDGRDRSDLVLTLLPGAQLSGTIAFDPSGQMPLPDLTGFNVSLASTAAYLGPAAAPRAVVEETGAFRFAGLAPATYSLRAVPPTSAGRRWSLKSAMVSGRDLADALFELRQGVDLSGLVVTFTDKAAEITGRIADAGGRPITRLSIVVFPVNQAMWQPQGRRLRIVQPGVDGAFSVTGLPAGEYGLAAAEGVDAEDLSDPSFLSSLLRSAVKVTLAEGEKKTQDLRAGRL